MEGALSDAAHMVRALQGVNKSRFSKAQIVAIRREAEKDEMPIRDRATQCSHLGAQTATVHPARGSVSAIDVLRARPSDQSLLH